MTCLRVDTAQADGMSYLLARGVQQASGNYIRTPDDISKEINDSSISTNQVILDFISVGKDNEKVCHCCF